MPFALVMIGLVMIVTGAKGHQSALGKQLVKDFTGPGNFFYWFFALGAIAAIGGVPKMRTFSNSFMTLIILAMIIRNGGVFDKFVEALKTGPIPPEVSETRAEGILNERVQSLGDAFDAGATIPKFVGTRLYDQFATMQSLITGINTGAQ